MCPSARPGARPHGCCAQGRQLTLQATAPIYGTNQRTLAKTLRSLMERVTAAILTTLLAAFSRREKADG